MIRRPPRSTRTDTLFPYTTLFRSLYALAVQGSGIMRCAEHLALPAIRKGLLVPLLEEFQHRDATAIHAVHVETKLTVPKVRSFIDRSEEHTSELQSLMRISYAVFCLKKKNKTTTRNTHQTYN